MGVRQLFHGFMEMYEIWAGARGFSEWVYVWACVVRVCLYTNVRANIRLSVCACVWMACVCFWEFECLRIPGCVNRMVWIVEGQIYVTYSEPQYCVPMALMCICSFLVSLPFVRTVSPQMTSVRTTWFSRRKRQHNNTCEDELEVRSQATMKQQSA